MSPTELTCQARNLSYEIKITPYTENKTNYKINSTPTQCDANLVIT
jgi:hypothetical protein